MHAEQQNENHSLIISSMELSKLFAVAIGWKMLDGKWFDPSGKQQARLLEYANNEILAWGALDGLSVSYTIAKSHTQNLMRVSVGTGKDDRFVATHRNLARAICTAVCLHKGVIEGVAPVVMPEG